MPLTRRDYECRQRELADLYRKLCPDLSHELVKFDPARKISKPFLIDLTAHNYPEAETKLVVVGQETNDWRWDERILIPGDDVDKLLFTYKDFSLGHNYNTPFFQAARTLYSRLNPQGPENGFIWTNLVKVDESTVGEGGRPRADRPGPDVEEKVASAFNVLGKEIELAEPHVVVFFTGPDYIERFRTTFPDVELVPVPVDGVSPQDGVGAQGWWRRMGVLLLSRPVSRFGQRWFYTYHPGGFCQGGHQADLDRVLEAIAKQSQPHTP